MKNYKFYETISLGSSDIATLILSGIKDSTGLSLEKLTFGEDGNYSAYLVDAEAEIGSHYTLVNEFTKWLKIYDDDECMADLSADIIKIYRAGEFGCIIQLFNANLAQCHYNSRGVANY